MLKGTARQVILLDSPDPELFERAVFIVRDEALRGRGGGEERVLREAQQVANDYLTAHFHRARRRRLPPVAWAALGAVLGALLCLLLF